MTYSRENTELALECLQLAQLSETTNPTDHVISRAKAYFNFIMDPNPKTGETQDSAIEVVAETNTETD